MTEKNNLNLKSISVSKYMTKNVVTATADQTIQSICILMHENNIGSVIIVRRVVDGLKPIGIITERDIIHQIGKVEIFTTQSSVRELMTNAGEKNLITINSDTSVSDAISTMQTNNIRRLPIIENKDKRMIGIITDKDILKIILRISGVTTSYQIPSTFNLSYEEKKSNNFRIT
ncbi:MAG TPA: CBS domain-containing protein [Nitrososphaeraceae archaeon]|jgi:CBS domain-containing protein